MSRSISPPWFVSSTLFFHTVAHNSQTSALQRSNLTHLVDLRHVHKQSFEGSTLVTIFAPTNHAFERLPRRLKLFLFSPFGGRILEKLLRFHIVPDLAFFSGKWPLIPMEQGLISSTLDYELGKNAEKLVDFGDLEVSGDCGNKPARRWFSKSVNDHICNISFDVNRSLLTLASTGHLDPNALLSNLSRAKNTLYRQHCLITHWMWSLSRKDSLFRLPTSHLWSRPK